MFWLLVSFVLFLLGFFLAFGSSRTMTKRDSVLAGFRYTSSPMSMPRVTHGDLAVMDIPVALLPLRTHLLILAVTLIPQRLMLDHPSHLQDQVTIHPIMGTPPQTRPHPSQLLPITRLQFFQDLKKKPIHSRWNWQKPVVSFTHTTLSRFKHLKLTNLNRHFADLW